MIAALHLLWDEGFFLKWLFMFLTFLIHSLQLLSCWNLIYPAYRILTLSSPSDWIRFLPLAAPSPLGWDYIFHMVCFL